MKDESQRHKHMIAVVAIVGGGGAIAPHSINFGPNPAQPQLDAAIIAAREAALAAYDQSSVAEHSTTAQYQLGINQDVTAKAIAANTNATQLKEAGIQSTMEQAIAAEEAAVQRQQIAAQQSVASQYASAQQTFGATSWGVLLPFSLSWDLTRPARGRATSTNTATPQLGRRRSASRSNRKIRIPRSTRFPRCQGVNRECRRRLLSNASREGCARAAGSRVERAGPKRRHATARTSSRRRASAVRRAYRAQLGHEASR
jgi:hypothetical protein